MTPSPTEPNRAEPTAPTPTGPEQIAADALERLGGSGATLHALGGGCLAPVYRAELLDGERLAVKVDPGASGALPTEARMLGVLRGAGALPVPEVVHADERALVMRYIENDGGASEDGGAAFGRALARLHSHRRERYGLGFDSCVGPIALRNPETASWAGFYRDHRLAPLAPGVIDRLPVSAARDLGWVLEHTGRCVEACGGADGPSLVHGDLWGGNALWSGGAIAAVIDPAVAYAHPSTDLAMMRLFGGFPRSAFDAYAEEAGHPAWLGAAGIALAQLWPALVHVTLFGASYHAMLADRLATVRAHAGGR